MPETPADGDPGCLLADLTARVPGARSAALVAGHGMVITEQGLGPDGADKLSATVSVMWMYARKASTIFGGEGRVRQVAVDGEGFMLHTAVAGTAILAVLADRETDAVKLGTEMRRIAEAIRPREPARPC
jgi:predicted regulator of Ras-like GTPase activity (Roadblock/LC7/MglB family)